MPDLDKLIESYKKDSAAIKDKKQLQQRPKSKSVSAADEISEQDMKCDVCEKTNAETEFGNDNSRCKKCTEVVRRIIRNKDRQETKSELKILSILYKGSKCVDCGLKFPDCPPIVFDFHHEVPSEKNININRLIKSRTSFYDVVEELDKCILLCSNCHRIRHSSMSRAYETYLLKSKKKKLSPIKFSVKFTLITKRKDSEVGSLLAIVNSGGKRLRHALGINHIQVIHWNQEQERLVHTAPKAKEINTRLSNFYNVVNDFFTPGLYDDADYPTIDGLREKLLEKYKKKK